eukprot:TRINITY_DN17594_c0_g1_i1.p1 TRINITY_DN17594_c0_g1~~TRINITY_DN17594_c0_g1_i1.p1  ORF type:complete len:1166 (+),score=359.54 TRINITY_DN17594_c0_g1_i1:518-3499(+)
MEHLVEVQKLDKFNINEFETPSPSDIRAMMHALKYNNYFKGIEAPDFPLGRDKAQLDAVFDCLKTNSKVESLDISNVGAKPENIVQLATALLANKNTQLIDLNLSGNPIEGVGVQSLCKFIETAPHGIVTLNFDNCRIDSKGFQALGAALKKNVKMAGSLTYINLSHNKIDPEGSVGICSFFSNPNGIRHLQIKETSANLETICGAIVRGCPELRLLDLSCNKITPKVIPHLTKWIGSSSSLETLNLSGTAIPPEGFRDILQAIASNVYLKNVTVKAKSNSLGVAGAKAIAPVLSSMKNIEALDIGDNDFTEDGVALIANALCENDTLRFLGLDANMSAKSKKGNAEGFGALITLIESNKTLNSLSLGGSKTMQPKIDDLLSFIYHVGVNDTVTELNLACNGMGNKGAIALGKALQTNKFLKTLAWDDNGTTVQGFVGFKVGLERNRTLKTMNLPILDISACMKELQVNQIGKFQKLVSDIGECVSRNQNPASRFEASKGFQMGALMLNMGQQSFVDAQLLKIKRNDPAKKCERDPYCAVLDDAAKTQKVITGFHLLKEETQDELDMALKKTLAGFVQEAAKVVYQTKSAMKSKMMELLEKNFESFDAETFRPLKTAIDYGAKPFDDSTLENILVNAAGTEILNKASEFYSSTVEVATDYVYEKVMDSLDDLFEDITSEKPEAEDEEEESDSATSAASPVSAVSAPATPTLHRVSTDSRGSAHESPAPERTPTPEDKSRVGGTLKDRIAMMEKAAEKPRTAETLRPVKPEKKDEKKEEKSEKELEKEAKEKEKELKKKHKLEEKEKKEEEKKHKLEEKKHKLEEKEPASPEPKPKEKPLRPARVSADEPAVGHPPPRAAARPMPGRLPQNLMLAAAIGRGPASVPRRAPGTPGDAAAVDDAAAIPAAPSPSPSPKPAAAAPRVPKPPTKSDKDSVLAQAHTAEPTGAALQHITKSRPRMSQRPGAKKGKGGACGRHPPSRRPRPVRASTETSV